MIKSKFDKGTQPCKDFSFPVIMQFVSHPAFIVLFYNEYSGTILSTTDGRTGKYENGLISAHDPRWRKLKGTITLENE